MITLKGAAVSAKIKEEVALIVKDLPGKTPKLAIVRVGDRPDDVSYERGALKKMENFGLRAESFCFPEDISYEAFKEEFSKINQDPDVDGILLLRPLPGHIKESDIAGIIDPEKDLDGISPENIARVFSGDPNGFAPCTAEAVIQVLKGYDIPIQGKLVTVVGRSMVVGRPLSMLLLKENATVTICHTRTENLMEVCRKAEILVVAAGQKKMIDASYVGSDAIVIDVGIHVDENGNLCGDVDCDSLEGKASMATPVPGGVGTVTTAVLAKHLVKAAERNR
ncbi:bifunctional 5,10-methylenetetrahydrofolate dehydrogenase/5,10-methenyltetrahydrofolate cyclohydrolase [Clostridium sp. E02]|uniref:bifunctional 5,10-methylenetetrahydrofolate dehydrogenase/5,10-methenyltetrahydrofolate cyclohydrolase n=1 Tax=Clostridium sp. E02 TaxID=2487134 RepID=UPI000F521E5C|nr:bifunctional 5,10-methylenetetrahydrofolate dehydrogenase/5,10-methenyltetrahydrofolate cyclohydrolase [Clostridium sp. E02]